MITASLLPGQGQRPAVYALWAVALAVQLGSPLVVRPRNLFELRAAHLAERHGALLLVALGESVVSIGVGAEELVGRTRQEDARVVIAAVLGLALAAALWWIIFAGGDEERAEQVLTAASQRAAHLAGPVRAVLREHPAAARRRRDLRGRAGRRSGTRQRWRRARPGRPWRWPSARPCSWRET